ITRDSASQSPVLHLASSTSPSLPSSSSSSLSSVPNLQSSRYFHVMPKNKQVHSAPPGFSLGSLGWVQHESSFGKGEETSVKGSTVSAYVPELSSNTERSKKKSLNDGLSNDRHLYSDHHLDDKSAVQCLLQTEVVRSLEEQLAIEKQRLLDIQSSMTGKLNAVHKPRERGLILQPSPHSGVSPWPGLNLSVPLQKDFTDTVLALRRQVWEGASFNIFESMTTCIDYYKTNNVRPPFTYASLIRWAILESPQKQLALNEIYHWFTKMFAFFRLNKMTWK
ncbi:hypothetical protein GDO81_003852, partial [Engystomops pustulosus]